MNAVREVLTGGPATAPGTPVAAVAGASNGGALAPTPSGSTSVARVQVSIGIAFLAAVATLIALNKLGFRFSATVG